MESFTINAVVLREARYKEADAIITLLTAEKGIITASVKGIYKSGSKNRAGVQLFCYSEFELTQGKGGYIVKTALLKELFYDIRVNPEFYAFACYISEIASAFCTSENDETEVFRLTLNAFASLNMKEDRKPLWQIKA
ncbi:MAG: DNA repair protein RecO, partial [Clostridia bacterium]|nr:DNA repair protein RecO [Clostridia bacterium]